MAPLPWPPDDPFVISFLAAGVIAALGLVFALGASALRRSTRFGWSLVALGSLGYLGAGTAGALDPRGQPTARDTGVIRVGDPAPTARDRALIEAERARESAMVEAKARAVAADRARADREAAAAARETEAASQVAGIQASIAKKNWKEAATLYRALEHFAPDSASLANLRVSLAASQGLSRLEAAKVKLPPLPPEGTPASAGEGRGAPRSLPPRSPASEADNTQPLVAPARAEQPVPVQDEAGSTPLAAQPAGSPRPANGSPEDDSGGRDPGSD